MAFLDKDGLSRLWQHISEKFSRALVKDPQVLTDDELVQVRKNLKFIGKNVEG
jgi:hypothetical protein